MFGLFKKKPKTNNIRFAMIESRRDSVSTLQEEVNSWLERYHPTEIISLEVKQTKREEWVAIILYRG